MKLSHSKKKDRGSIAVCILQSRKVFFSFVKTMMIGFAKANISHREDRNIYIQKTKHENLLISCISFFSQLLDTYKQKNSTLTFEGKGILMCIPYFRMTQFQIGNMKLLFSFLK